MTKEQAAAGYTSALDVEFVYDGQTYKPTDLLVTSDGDANAYKSASTTDRDRWANDSMALDINRDEVDARIGQVYGFTPIDGEGNTTGTISGTVGTALTTSSVSWLGVDPSKKDIAVAGAYTLVSDSTVAGAIEVASANTYDLNNGTVTITAGAYVTDVLVDGSSVGEYVAPSPAPEPEPEG